MFEDGTVTSVLGHVPPAGREWISFQDFPRTTECHSLKMAAVFLMLPKDCCYENKISKHGTALDWLYHTSQGHSGAFHWNITMLRC